MLSQLRLRNFKSARELPVSIRPLTVLAGLNGSGKSTVLQSLAVLKQSLDEGGRTPRLHLRGPLVQLGRGQDVLFEGATEDEIEIAPTTSSGSARFVGRVVPGSDTLELVSPVQDLGDLFDHFQYIQADRITPRTQYDQASAVHVEKGWLGVHGEFTVDFLRLRGADKVSAVRAFPRDALGVSEDLYKRVAPTDTLIDQTAGWLQQLSPGVQIFSEEIGSTDAVSLLFQYTGTSIASGSRRMRATNVGFGLTYSLPIVVACLACPRGALVLLENPEAHLHPQGQAALGSLLARAAADGVQILVETHSDHVLNGIRIAVKGRTVGADDVALNYFIRDAESAESTIQFPKVMPDGQLMDWPVGFFDQWDRSLSSLLE
jgi:predicted ATPase